MEPLIQFLTSVDHQAPDYTIRALGLSLLLSFVLGQLIAWTYSRTHSGLSYSRSFTQSLVLMTIVVSLVMFVIGNNIITAFGLIGALALIRFRNVMKDTRDTVFVFFSLVLGMAAGSQRYTAAIVGSVVLVFIVFYMHLTAFGSVGRYDGHLTCRINSSLEEQREIFFTVLRRFCRSFHQVSSRQGTDYAEYVFQVRLRDHQRGREMSQELNHVEGVDDVILVLHDEFAEI